MNTPGVDNDLVAPRKALLDALDALEAHRDALVLIGAQAIYLWTGNAAVALAETTDDSDLAIDRRVLSDDPLLEEAMRKADFHPNVLNPQPGAWVSRDGVEVDLMLPEALSDAGGRRSGRIPPHSSHAVRRTVGLEAAVVDSELRLIHSFDPTDDRAYEIRVATPAALLVAKLHKLGERQENPHRLLNKDAHDMYRILVAIPTQELAESLRRLSTDQLAGEVTGAALDYLELLFADGPEALGSQMAGQAEETVGDPEVVAASVTTLASDLLATIRGGRG